MSILKGFPVPTLVALSLTAVALTGAESAPATPMTAPLSMEFSADPGEDCILLCADGLWCDPGEHDAWWVDPETAQNDYGEGYHSVSNPCWEGTCDKKHPTCLPGGGGGGGDHLVADLRRGVEDQDLELVRTAMVAVGLNAAVLVPERSALQVTGCDGRVLLHLPVSIEFGRRLAE